MSAENLTKVIQKNTRGEVTGALPDFGEVFVEIPNFLTPTDEYLRRVFDLKQGSTMGDLLRLDPPLNPHPSGKLMRNWRVSDLFQPSKEFEKYMPSGLLDNIIRPSAPDSGNLGAYYAQDYVPLWAEDPISGGLVGFGRAKMPDIIELDEAARIPRTRESLEMPNSPMRTLIHELNHLIHRRFGGEGGANVDMITEKLLHEKNPVMRELYAAAHNKNATIGDVARARDLYEKNYGDAILKIYRRMLGESLAEGDAKRLFMPKDEMLFDSFFKDPGYAGAMPYGRPSSDPKIRELGDPNSYIPYRDAFDFLDPKDQAWIRKNYSSRLYDYQKD